MLLSIIEGLTYCVYRRCERWRAVWHRSELRVTSLDWSSMMLDVTDRRQERSYWTEAMNWFVLDTRKSQMKRRSVHTHIRDLSRERWFKIASNKLHTQSLIAYVVMCGKVTVGRPTTTENRWICKVTHTWLKHARVRKSVSFEASFTCG